MARTVAALISDVQTAQIDKRRRHGPGYIYEISKRMNHNLHLYLPRTKDAFINFVCREFPSLFCSSLIEPEHSGRFEDGY